MLHALRYHGKDCKRLHSYAMIRTETEVLFEIAYGGDSLEKLFSAVSATTTYVMTKLIPEYLYLALGRFDVTDVTSDHYFYAGAQIVQHTPATLHINQGRHVRNPFSKIVCSLWQDVQCSCCR